MLAHLRDIPGQCSMGWTRGLGLDIPSDYCDIDSIVVVGMGGSAMGADLARSLIQDQLSIPMVVVRDYGLPAYVGRRTLVILSSYSGSTEETMTAFHEAASRGAKIIAVGGGELLEKAPGPAISICTRAMPRAAMVESMMLLLGILTKCGFIADIDLMAPELPGFAEKQSKRFDVVIPETDNPAKCLARSLVGRVPVVIGSGITAPVARRWKAQFNENGDQWAVMDELPEFSHNTIQGINLPSRAANLFYVIMLVSEDDRLQTRRQAEVGSQLITEAGIPVETVKAEGNDCLSRLISLIIYGDYTSYYVALLNRVDPTDIPLIAELKTRMSTD